MAGNSKQAILDVLRGTAVEAVPLPDLDGPWTEFADPRRQFLTVLSAVGGNGMVVHNLEQLNAELAKIPAYRDAKKVCSVVAGVHKANVDAAAYGDPHQFEDVDFFVAPGEFAVAENAAVWVHDRALRHRVLYFLSQHVALVVPAGEMVSNMHQAYERLSFEQPYFGMFLCGPSKTADIEQSLVIGAHGARSLTVFLLDGGT
jgi:L-lactate dehydrogenase complex protein LldG